MSDCLKSKSEPILSIRDLCVDYITEDGSVRAIDHVSLDVFPGEILGIAGESGSGKTTLAKALMRILPPPAVITKGQVLFAGRDILDLSEDELQALRWSKISMVFQSAMDALNPVISIGEQIIDTLEAHADYTKDQAEERARYLLEMVGLPGDRLTSFAHQLSGGMRQRVGIALALALEPSIIILDEPTTALDVLVESDILAEIRELQKELGFAVIFVTHDLSRMLQVSDRVAIFYSAQLAEVGPVDELRDSPGHPYTRGLLRAFPSVHGDGPVPESIPGNPPSLASPPSGCRFNPRCAKATALCRTDKPADSGDRPGRTIICHHPYGDDR